MKSEEEAAGAGGLSGDPGLNPGLNPGFNPGSTPGAPSARRTTLTQRGFIVIVDSALDGDEAWATAKAFETAADDGPGRLVGVGCDTETRQRLALALERHPRFLARWFDADERALVAAAPDPVGEALRRFCLKEAVVKALWEQERLTPREVGTAEEA